MEFGATEKIPGLLMTGDLFSLLRLVFHHHDVTDAALLVRGRGRGTRRRRNLRLLLFPVESSGLCLRCLNSTMLLNGVSTSMIILNGSGLLLPRWLVRSTLRRMPQNLLLSLLLMRRLAVMRRPVARRLIWLMLTTVWLRKAVIWSLIRLTVELTFYDSD